MNPYAKEPVTTTDVYSVVYWRIGNRRFPTLDDAIRFCRRNSRILLEARGYNRLGNVVTHLTIRERQT